jgi:predicted aconitase with swiveling domain
VTPAAVALLRDNVARLLAAFVLVQQALAGSAPAAAALTPVAVVAVLATVAIVAGVPLSRGQRRTGVSHD